jgi:hypothetical protein
LRPRRLPPASKVRAHTQQVEAAIAVPVYRFDGLRAGEMWPPPAAEKPLRVGAGDADIVRHGAGDLYLPDPIRPVARQQVETVRAEDDGEGRLARFDAHRLGALACLSLGIAHEQNPRFHLARLMNAGSHANLETLTRPSGFGRQGCSAAARISGGTGSGAAGTGRACLSVMNTTSTALSRLTRRAALRCASRCEVRPA